MMAETGHPRNTKVELYLPPEDDCSIVFVPPGTVTFPIVFFPFRPTDFKDAAAATGGVWHLT